MITTRGDPQAAQLLKLLHEFKSSSVGISSDHSRRCEGGANWLWDVPLCSDKRIGHVPCHSFTMTPRLTLLSSPSVSGKI
jgi:hypothetical protein